MSTFFRDNQRKVQLLPYGSPGFRTPQLGAACALLSHSTRFTEPAVVSLPTGTGKTAVLQLTPFLWSSSRVLVLTPSRLVREQIEKGFESLHLLKSLGILPADLACPNVQSIEGRIDEADKWESLRPVDVVVSTPMSLSPSIAGIACPPSDLFDLIVVDEAHHVPASSYMAILDAFPTARKAFFTATPFRRDKKQLPGKLIYNYPMRNAIEDGTYGKVEFVPCIPEDSQDHDVAIARLAQSMYLDDTNAGFDHRLMVRTDSVKRARDLLNIYENETSLKLKLIHGGNKMAYVRSVMKHLREGMLDGIVCVDMFGEGVDFPRLKLAALHSPHKSLAVTLQFIGRFARTNASELGAAKFIAVPQEIDSEVRELYKTGASWEYLVANLADARVQEEEAVREGLSSFSAAHTVDSDDSEITVDSLHPYFHAKVYRTSSEPRFDLPAFVPSDCRLLYEAQSDDLLTRVVIYERATKPKWLGNASLSDVKNYLYLVHYDRFDELLFVNSQEHAEESYEAIIGKLFEGPWDSKCRELAHSEISRALRTLRDPSFFNLGMRNQELGGADESYRTLTGPKADRRVTRSDAAIRSRGHVFGGCNVDGQVMTLGVSSLSKVWSNQYGLIPKYVDWCREIAAEIKSDAPVMTGSNLDLLNTGQRVESLPSVPVGIVWNEKFYQNPPLLRVDGDERDITGLDVMIEIGSETESTFQFCVLQEETRLATFQVSLDGRYKVIQLSDTEVEVRFGGAPCTFATLIEQHPPSIFLSDFSLLVGSDWITRSHPEPLDFSFVETFPEFNSSVDIEREVGTPRAGMITIHEFTEKKLLSQSPDILVYDHRSGEVADFIALWEKDDHVLCRIAHCKGASGKKSDKIKSAGTGVSNAYEVAGQVVKSIGFCNRPVKLKDKLVDRIAGMSQLKRGSTEKMKRILDSVKTKHFRFEVCLVQPGLSSSKLSEAVERVLASACEYVQANGAHPLLWLSE